MTLYLDGYYRNSLKPINTYLPVTTWSLNPSLIVHILNDIIVNNRKSIIEFGSGLSTFYIAHLIKKNKLDVKFYSVDSNNDWIEIVKRNLKDEQILEQVKMIYSPLTPSDFDFKEHKEWYDTKVLDDHLSEDIFDLVIVDGPWGGFKYGRFGAVSYLFPDKLDNNYFIVLDDTHRTEEMEIVEKEGAESGIMLWFVNQYYDIKKT